MMITVVPASEPLPMDSIGAAFLAYGLRLLDKDYAGDCVDVRRSSDDQVATIGFDANGNIDGAAVVAHCGANDGFVSKWWDQSGNARHLVNATTATQPKIVDAGTLLKTIQFREDFLDAALGTALANNPLTILAVLQSQPSWTDTISQWFTLTGNCLAVHAETQSVRVLSYDGGGNWQFTGDSNDKWFPTLRQQHLCLRLDSADCDCFFNGTLFETLTLVEYGASSSTLRLGGTGVGSGTDISEVIVYSSALTDSQIATLYRSMNQWHRVGPDDPPATYSVAARWPADAVILRWINGLSESELTVTRGNLSWDDTYADTDDLMRIYQVFDGGYVNYRDYVTAMLANPVWFRINPDPNGDGGMDGAHGFHHFQSGRGEHGTEAGTMALFYANSLPKAAGAEGNPYYGQRAVARRAIISAAYSLMAYMRSAEQSDGNHQTDFIGGNLMAAGFAFNRCRDVLPSHVQNAYLDMLFIVCQKLWWLRAHDTNGNMDVKAIAGLAQCSAAFGDDTARKTVCVEAAKRILFGSTTGTAATTDKSAGIYALPGYVDEADSPDTTYNGHALNLMLEAYRVTSGDALWSFLGDVVSAMISFKMHQYFIDPDGYQDGPSGYAGRTGGSYVFDQGTESWRQANIAAADTLGRPIQAALGNEASLVASINSTISLWNNTTDIDNDCIDVTGTAAAHTNGSASTTITLTNTPDLSGTVIDHNLSVDWQSYLWLDVNGGTWSKVTAFDDTANTVTVTNTFNIASGAAVDYRIERGPKSWTGQGTWWPPENYYPVPDGYYDAQRARIVASDPTLDTVWEASADLNVNFGDEFWCFKDNDGTRDFGFFVEAIENVGSYNGWYGGTLQVFWARDTGTVICSRHDKAGTNDPAANENTRVWSVIDSWATTHIYGIDAGDKGFSSAAIENNTTNPTSTFDINGTPKSVVRECTLDAGVTSGFEAGTGITGSFVVRNTFEATASGVRHLSEVEHTGSDTIKELWAVIPVYLRDTDQSMSDTTIEYWNGSTWTALATSLVTATYVRLSRDFGSGAKYVWIVFTAAKRIKLNAAVWVQSYQGDSRHRMIKINLLPVDPDGTGKAFPAAASADYTITTIDPEP